MKQRLNYMDNLRTFLIFLVVLYHSVFVFTSSLEAQWIVVDSSKNENLGLIGMYIDTFVMFGLFLISGYFIPTSANKESTISFIYSKFTRIVVPWFVGIMFLIPLYKILFLYSRGLPQEEWFSYFHWFKRAGTDLFFYANNPLQGWLWFLPVLFTFQLLYLALDRLKLLYLKTGIVTAISLLVVISVGYSMIISETGNAGWFHSIVYHFQNERLGPYFLTFLFGAYISKNGQLEKWLTNRSLYIGANVLMTIFIGIYTIVALNLFFNLIDPTREVYFINSFADRIVYYASIMICMLSILYLLFHAFRKWMNTSNNLLSALARNSYYVYIVHMVALGMVALPLVAFQIPVIVKFVILIAGTYLLSNILVSLYYKVLSPRLSLKLAFVAILIVGFFVFAKTSGANTSEIQVNSDISVVAIHQAVIDNNIESIRWHIDHGSDLDSKEISGGATPLILAAVFDRSEIAFLLLQAGADPDLVNKDGSTALHSAAFFCHKEIVATLLDHEAKCDLRNNAGATAFESVSGPFEQVKPVYEYFSNQGLELNTDEIKVLRPVIAEMIKTKCR